MKHLADEEGYETFVVPDDVGGRYSVLTAVGLLPIAVAGADIDALMLFPGVVPSDKSQAGRKGRKQHQRERHSVHGPRVQLDVAIPHRKLQHKVGGRQIDENHQRQDYSKGDDENYVTRYARKYWVFTKEGEKVITLPDDNTQQ